MVSPRITSRKTDHIKICASKNVESERTNGLEDVLLVHRSAPEIDMENVDTTFSFMGHRLSFPFIIEAITGGTSHARRINQRLAEAAENLQVAMGVGSQRIALEDPAFEPSFRIAREVAPSAFLIANIGAPQLSMGYGVDEAKRSVEMISANALAIHLNAVQESVQPEGETVATGVIQKIDKITKEVGVPVIVKETGAGISAEEARRFKEVGVSGVDIAGVGGTDWARVEDYRNRHERSSQGMAPFYGWGISTAASLVEVVQSTGLTAIASGGIRNGLQIAKSIALGASAAGLARPLLSPALTTTQAVKNVIQAIHRELKTTMFLTGAKTVSDLQKTPLVIVGNTYHWLTQRGFDTTRYARRN